MKGHSGDGNAARCNLHTHAAMQAQSEVRCVLHIGLAQSRTVRLASSMVTLACKSGISLCSSESCLQGGSWKEGGRQWWRKGREGGTAVALSTARREECSGDGGVGNRTK